MTNNLRKREYYSIILMPISTLCLYGFFWSNLRLLFHEGQPAHRGARLVWVRRCAPPHIVIASASLLNPQLPTAHGHRRRGLRHHVWHVPRVPWGGQHEHPAKQRRPDRCSPTGLHGVHGNQRRRGGDDEDPGDLVKEAAARVLLHIKQVL